MCIIWKCCAFLPASLNASKCPVTVLCQKRFKVILQHIKLHKQADVNMSPLMEMRITLGNLTQTRQYQADCPQIEIFILSSS